MSRSFPRNTADRVLLGGLIVFVLLVLAGSVGFGDFLGVVLGVWVLMACGAVWLIDRIARAGAPRKSGSFPRNTADRVLLGGLIVFVLLVLAGLVFPFPEGLAFGPVVLAICGAVWLIDRIARAGAPRR